MKKQIIIYVSVAVAVIAAVIAGVVLIRNGAKSEPAQTAAAGAPTTSNPTAAPAPTQKATEDMTDAAQDETDADTTDSIAQTEQPTAADTTVKSTDELDAALALNGATAQQVYDSGCRQLITVDSGGSNSAVINLYNFADNAWVRSDEHSCSGYVGLNGVTTEMSEGSYASPKGLYSVGEAFYMDAKPKTGLPSFQITSDTYWVDDPSSAYYNQRVVGTDKKDWNSAEDMINCYPEYEYGFVINYNTECVPGAGSAIFFHVSSGPTAGCVGTSRDMVLSYLSALDASLNPYILIV